MRRATVTITDEIEAHLDAYVRQQEVSPPLTDARKLRITPAKKGSGAKDVSVDHDRYLASH